MDFGLRDDQEQLRSAVREYLEAELPTTFARQSADSGAAFPEARWQDLAKLGWIGLAAPESVGGSGLGLLDLALVLEEAGRVVLPGPFVPTVALAMPLLAHAGALQADDGLVAGLIGGGRRAAVAWAGSLGSWEPGALEGSVERERDGYRLDARKLFVPEAGEATDLLVVLPLDDGAAVFVVPRDAAGVSVQQHRTVDRTQRLFRVTLDGVHVPAGALVGGRPVARESLERVLDHARIGSAALMVGAADRLMTMTVEYLGLREQFGRPLATLQALQHRCADMKVAVEHARSLVYYAAWAWDSRGDDAPLAAAMAKAFASEQCPRVAADAIQLHGGIGFTWEHDAQLFFKRLKAEEQAYGDAVANRERVAAFLERRG